VSQLAHPECRVGDDRYLNLLSLRNTLDSTASPGAHHQRPRAINAAGISSMKNTGGTSGYGAPPEF
jgi:hypothetical protein